jgi:TPP-dependent pyruvate/acetoin dehydrogenase alpha subunit
MFDGERMMSMPCQPAGATNHASIIAPPDLEMETAIETQVFAQADVNRSLTPAQKIDLLRVMFRIRRFEQAALKQYQTSGQTGGFLHLYIGQESVAVGTISLCGDDDHVIAGYRSHGNALAVGMSMNECMAELFGRAAGCSKGKGGSMHFFAPDKHYWGGHGIVAGQTPLGLGLAFGLKYKGGERLLSLLSGRWRGQPRCLSGLVEPGLPLESAGDLHHRKQPILDGHQS